MTTRIRHSGSVVERFWKRVDKNGPVHPVLGTSCWLWTASVNHAGYGWFRAGRTVLAHRFSWSLSNGPIPSGLKVCHHCDNPPCVNPAHSFLGTDLDNTRDRNEKGRNPMSRKTHCKRGHEFTEENTYDHGGHRDCRTCERARDKKRRQQEPGLTR